MFFSVYKIIVFQGRSRVVDLEEQHHGFFHEGSVYIVLKVRIEQFQLSLFNSFEKHSHVRLQIF